MINLVTTPALTHTITNYHDKYNYIINIIINYRGATHSHTYQLISAK